MNRPYPVLFKRDKEEAEKLAECFQIKREYNPEMKYKLIPLDNCPRCGKVIRVDRFNYMRHLFNCVKARRRYRI